MNVKDVMSAGKVVYCTPETKLANAARMMKDSNRGALPVVDKDKKVIGIVTDRDICLSLATHIGKSPADLSVKEILPKAKLYTVKTDDSLKDALREMRLHKIGRLPVTDKEGKLKGIVTVNTLLSKVLEKKDELGTVSSQDETLAKTIKALYDRNNEKKNMDIAELV